MQGRRLRPRQTLPAASSHASAAGAMPSSRASGQPRQGSPNITDKASSCLFQRAPSHLSPTAQRHPVTTSWEGLDRRAHSGCAPVHQVRCQGAKGCTPFPGPRPQPCALTRAEGKQTRSVSRSRVPPSVRARGEEEEHMLCVEHTAGRRAGKRGATLVSGPRGGGVVCSDPRDHMARGQGLSQHCKWEACQDPMLLKCTCHS